MKCIKYRAGNLLICSSFNRSFAHLLICSFAHSLIRSFGSNQMSNCEQFAPIAQDKWATVSKSLRSLREEMSDHERIPQVTQDKWGTMSDLLMSLRGNEGMSNLLKKCWLKKSKILFQYVLYTIFFFFYWKNEQIAHFLFFGEQCEWITHFAQIKWTMSANCSGRPPKMSDH